MGMSDGHHHPEPESYAALRTKALESLLVEKGLIASDAIAAVVQAYEQDIGPRNGAKVVARAWINPAYKEWLLKDATAAIAALGFVTGQGAELVVAENTPRVHNLIVCTLCSCYPAGLLGLPPTWYKDFAYRSRAVIEPRQVLRELGLELDDTVEIRVWDSTAELRYMVLPEQPEGTAHLSEEALAALVTRDAMIGVAKVVAPARV
jgi:nitrile hydratase